MLVPHCPGEIQTPLVSDKSRTMANPAGLKIWRPSARRANFEAMAAIPASAGSQAEFARNSRLSDKPVMSGERRSIRVDPDRRVQTTCVSNAVAIANAL